MLLRDIQMSHNIQDQLHKLVMHRIIQSIYKVGHLAHIGLDALNFCPLSGSSSQGTWPLDVQQLLQVGDDLADLEMRDWTAGDARGGVGPRSVLLRSVRVGA